MKLPPKAMNVRSMLQWQKQKRNASLFFAVVLGAVLLIVVQQTFGGAHSPDQLSGDNDRLLLMMTSAIYDANKPAVVEPYSKQVFLPDASIALPPYPDPQMQVRYSYSDAPGSPKSMQVTTDQAVRSGIAKVLGAEPSNDMKAVFAEVPNAQACSRGVSVSFDDRAASHSDDGLLFSKKLLDGRQMNVYEQNTCQGYDFQPLIDYLKKADSY